MPMPRSLGISWLIWQVFSAGLAAVGSQQLRIGFIEKKVTVSDWKIARWLAAFLALAECFATGVQHRIRALSYLNF